MTFSAVIRFTGAIIVALSLVVAVYGPNSALLALGVGAAAAYGLVLLAGGAFTIRKLVALFSSTAEKASSSHS